MYSGRTSFSHQRDNTPSTKPYNDSTADYPSHKNCNQQPPERLDSQSLEHLRSTSSTFSQLKIPSPAIEPEPSNVEESTRTNLLLPTGFKTSSDQWRGCMTQKPLSKTFHEQNRKASAEWERSGRQGWEWVWTLEGSWVKRESSASLPLPNEKSTLKRLKRSMSMRKTDGVYGSGPQNISSSSARHFSEQASISHVADADNRITKKPLILSSAARSSYGTSFGASKILRGFQYMSPTYPHFKSPTGEPEGLYCKTKRGIEGGLRGKPKEDMLMHDLRSQEELHSIATGTLEGVTSALNRCQQDFAPPGESGSSPTSPQRSGGRIGIAPWHRRNSQDSTWSATSSIREILRGKAPASTPNPEMQYGGHKGKKYAKVDITRKGLATFLPSEAVQIPTPPTSSIGTASVYTPSILPDVDFSDNDEDSRVAGSDRPLTSSNASRTVISIRPPRRKEILVSEDQIGAPKFDWSVPDHLPNSPLCPLYPNEGGIVDLNYSSLKGDCIATAALFKMDSSPNSLHDSLLLLRQSIAADSLAIPTTSEDISSSAPEDISLAIATHLQFSSPLQLSLPLDTPTRFISSGQPADLRSIYFAWLNRELTIPEYSASALALNAEVGEQGGAGGKVQNLAFVERVELITWLAGASEESEYIKPLTSDSSSAITSVQVASGAVGSIVPTPSGTVGRQAKIVDLRLAEIYNGERRMGDRNSILRGIKPTDFSHVRKMAAIFTARKAQHPAAANIANNPSLAMNPKTTTRRPDPIILLSPSASSLLRMSNIRSFLETGVYTPPEPSMSTSSSSASILNLSRVLPSIDPVRPIRFIIVDTPELFKPAYWSRVVAVFTTGQLWQFKNYKWSQPTELFRNTLGIYVGWRGEPPPDTVKSWGRGVLATGLDKWNATAGSSARWRDREIVEAIWKGVEDNMRHKGWTKDLGPTAS